MSLEGLLAFVGIVVAAYAIARPVQRASLSLFVPVWFLPFSCIVSLMLIVARDAPMGMTPLFDLTVDSAGYFLGLFAFLIPILGGLSALFLWHRAKLTGRNVARFPQVLRSTLLESEFSEIDRILQNNYHRVHLIPQDTIGELYEPQLACKLARARSYIHIELLTNASFVERLPDRFAAVDSIVRALFCAESSPLRAVVTHECCGQDCPAPAPWQIAVVNRTFRKPSWYFPLRADYPLLMLAIEQIQSGIFDERYNSDEPSYYAMQGMTTRRNCPIYIAVKTHVLAPMAHLESGISADYDPYCTDLSDIFTCIMTKSRYRQRAWKPSNTAEPTESNWDHPTPYSFLLYDILDDIKILLSKASKIKRSEASKDTSDMHLVRVNRFAAQAAKTWSICIGALVEPNEAVSDRFCNDAINAYLMFTLDGTVASLPSGINVSDLCISELRHQMRYASASSRDTLKNLILKLDPSIDHVRKGKQLLVQQLLGE